MITKSVNNRCLEKRGKWLRTLKKVVHILIKEGLIPVNFVGLVLNFGQNRGEDGGLRREQEG
jgi:hypothetical protein